MQKYRLISRDLHLKFVATFKSLIKMYKLTNLETELELAKTNLKDLNNELKKIVGNR